MKNLKSTTKRVKSLLPPGPWYVYVQDSWWELIQPVSGYVVDATGSGKVLTVEEFKVWKKKNSKEVDTT